MNPTDIGRVAALMLGPGTTELIPLPASHNDVFRLSHRSNTYLLKRFPPDKKHALVREMRLSRHFVRHGWTATPRLLATYSDDSGHFALYEFIEGDSLSELWEACPARIPEDLRRLGVLLGELHEVPLHDANLTPEETLFTGAYFERMCAALDPGSTRLRAGMERCYERVCEGHARFDDLVVHGDYGPHQIVVGQNER
jgi:Ser/Thr protein kinase RdoA (MazF antagonist)